MKHFIKIDTMYLSHIYYFHNDDLNKIMDFSEFYYNNNSYEKVRKYRGNYFYSKKPHYERSDGIKSWCYNNRWYSSYEEYMMAVIG